MQKKPILYDLVALVFPRVIGYAYAEGHGDAWQGNRDHHLEQVKHYMAGLESFHPVSLSEDDTGGVYYSLYVSPTEPANAD